MSHTARRKRRSRYPLSLDDSLRIELRDAAKSRGTTQQSIIEEALRKYLAAKTADDTEGIIAPLITQLIQDQHRVLGKGIRTLLVRLGHEILRNEYVLLNFMAFAGVSPGQVDTWHEEGWKYAIRELKRKVEDLDAGMGSGSEPGG